jgi:diacylglycerol kinase family enzyme
MPSYLVVVNPKSGRGEGLARAEMLRSALSAADDVHVVATEGRGGDGTLNEVLTGLLRLRAPPHRLPALGFLASGTANVATRAFGLAATPSAAAHALHAAEARPVDVGIVSSGGEERPFLLWFGAGYDAIAIDALNRKRTGLMGIFGLVRKFPSVVKALHAYPAPEITVLADGDRERSGASTMMANVGAMGFGSTATTAADPYDGHMDLLTVPRTGTIGVVGLWVRMTLSSLERSPGVDRIPVTEARFETDGEVPFQLDGEPVGTLPAAVRVLPGAVRLLMT